MRVHVVVYVDFEGICVPAVFTDKNFETGQFYAEVMGANFITAELDDQQELDRFYDDLEKLHEEQNGSSPVEVVNEECEKSGNESALEAPKRPE